MDSGDQTCAGSEDYGSRVDKGTQELRSHIEDGTILRRKAGEGVACCETARESFQGGGIEDIRKGAGRVVSKELGGCSIHALEGVGGLVGREPSYQRTLDEEHRGLSAHKRTSWSSQMPYSGRCYSPIGE